MNEEKKSSPGNSKLSTIFLVVLGLHVVVIVLILAYNLLKGGGAPEEENYFGSVTPASSYEPAPLQPSRTADEPYLQTGGAEEELVEPSSARARGGMSMPSPQDPIWAMGTVEPRDAEVSEPVESALDAPPEKPLTAGDLARLSQGTATPSEPAAPSFEEEVRQTAAPQTYQVVKGDSLSRIGTRFGVSVADLQKANQMDGTMIRIGEVLQIPNGAVAQAAPRASIPTAVPAATPVETPASIGKTHVVSKGETLWRIARQYDINAQKLADYNGIADPKRLKVGTRLNIPASGQQMARPVQGGQPPRVQDTDVAMVRE